MIFSAWRPMRPLLLVLGACILGPPLLAADALILRTGTAHGALAAAPLLADSPWPKYRGDLLHTGRSPHTGPASNQLKWTFATGRRDAHGGIETDPVIGRDGSVILGANNGILYALDPGTGEIRWAFPTGFDTFAIYSTPVVDRQGTVYFGAKDGRVYALRSPRTGIMPEVVWSLTLGTTIQTSPTLTPDGTLVIGADDWAYYGITPPRGTTGPTIAWRFQTQGTLITSPAVDADGTVYVASMDGNVYALEPPKSATGPVRVRWTFPSGARDDKGGFENAPAIDEQGTLYIGGNDGVLYALDAKTGKVRWTFDGVARAGYRSYAIFSSAAIAPDRTITFGGKDGVLYALRERRGLFSTGPEVLWRYKVGAGIQSSPLTAADGTVYLGDEQGTLHAVRPPPTGEWAKALWTFSTKGTLISSAALDADGTLYTASMDGTVYAFHDNKRGRPTQGPLSGTWYGTYRDTGSRGEMTLVLVQTGGEIHGIFKLKGGPRGSLVGQVAGGQGSFVLRSAVPECPGSGEGTVRIEGEKLRGQYRGEDCRGKIDGGTFEVAR
jgi:outer membrane protein assembly factor BamB